MEGRVAKAGYLVLASVLLLGWGGEDMISQHHPGKCTWEQGASLASKQTPKADSSEGFGQVLINIKERQGHKVEGGGVGSGHRELRGCLLLVTMGLMSWRTIPTISNSH